MQKLTCIIVDDEQHVIDLFIHHIKKIPHLQILGTFYNALEAINFLHENTVDLIFTDIEMSGISGIDFIKITGRNSDIVIVSAHRQYALDGFENSVLDYILKPVQLSRLLQVVEKAIKQQALKIRMESGDEDFIIVKADSKNKLIKIEISDILYIEGLKNYISIHTSSQRYITLLNIKAIEEQLPINKFFRIHKSFIVALNKVKHIDGNQVFLKDVKEGLPVSDSYRLLFINMMKEKLVGNKKSL